MLLIPEIDEKKTRQNARNLLSTYRSKKRLIIGGSIDPYSLVRSTEITDDPMHHSNLNGVEKTVLFKLRNVGQITLASEEIRSIDQALAALPDISRRILDYSYCTANKFTTREIAMKLEIYRMNSDGVYEKIIYSEKNIEKLKSQALIEFAEAYSNGELLVVKQK